MSFYYGGDYFTSDNHQPHDIRQHYQNKSKDSSPFRNSITSSKNSHRIQAHQMQMQTYKQNQLSQQQQGQLMFDDYCAMLYGQVERLFQMCGAPVSSTFSAYLPDHHVTKLKAMLDIEMSLLGIQSLSSISLNQLGKQTTFPEDTTGTVKYWNGMLDQIHRIPENSVPFQILKHTVDCINGKAIKELPLHLSEEIVSQQNRRIVREDLVNNDQAPIMNANYNVQQCELSVANEIKEFPNEIAHKIGKVHKKPLIIRSRSCWARGK